MPIVNSLPYNILDGTTGDAVPVMANYNQILNDVNNNAAHNAANSDITSISGLVTPLSVSQGGTGGSASTGTGAVVLANSPAILSPTGIVASDVGLGNVNNTSDANKPVSTAQASAIAARYGTNNVLGTVSQSGGVPTGSVIESGINARGNYVKFADGTMICTNPALVGGQTVTAATGAIFTSPADEAWTYPKPFVSLPALSFWVSGAVNYTWVGASQTTASTSLVAYFRAFASVSIGTGPTFSCTAIGRWF